MKTLLALIICLFTINVVSAQVASFNTSTAKEKIDETNVKFTFTVDGISSSHEEMTKKFNSASGVKKVENKGNVYAVYVAKSNSKKTMQSILMQCGINEVVIDGKQMKTSELADYYREQKGAK
jgi:hypothetical protein